MVENSRAYGRRMIEGIAAYAQDNASWLLRPVTAGEALSLNLSRFGGIIARIADDRLAARIQASGRPAVDVFCQKPRLGLAGVDSDHRQVGVMAREFFRSRGFANFAYCGFPGTSFSDAREKAYSDASTHVYSPRTRHLPDESQFYDERVDRIPDARALSRWLKTLPRPSGIFVVNDRAAICVVSAAQKAGLDVPHDIAVVGVDNDVMQCENSSVPISSVPLDREGGGRVAAELLHALMKGRKPTRGGLIGAQPIVRRASSRRFADSRVSAAVEHIRLHACEGLKVDDVVRTMGCSRALAYLRFGEAVGHSILDEIHHIRLERAKGLLKAGKHSIGMVADSCGYASAVDFRRTFKRIVGKTPKAWQSQAKVC